MYIKNMIFCPLKKKSMRTLATFFRTFAVQKNLAP